MTGSGKSQSLVEHTVNGQSLGSFFDSPFSRLGSSHTRTQKCHSSTGEDATHMASAALRSFSFEPLLIPAAQGFGLKARFTPVENVPTLFDVKFLVDRHSPKRAAVADYYSRLPRNRLSWRVISNISSKQVNKAVLRNRLKRRWASAFAQALKDHGYHHNGNRRIIPNDGKKYVAGLKGTLEILIYSDRGIDCAHRELIGASHALVKSLARKAKQLEASTDATTDGKAQEKGPPKNTEAEADVSSSLWSRWRKLL